jgi:diaminohydroxyphosphoribosylaminopyrimidine deaminase/5-amino-6-(5-phosphoribosylamino)uracil reductase
MFVTLEPCAHKSARGPACADLVSASGLARVVVGCADPDPRTAGFGMERIRAAGIAAELADLPESRASLEGYLMQRRHGRPHVTLKLATSLDGCIALASGESQWITGPKPAPIPTRCAPAPMRFWWVAAHTAPMRRVWMYACPALNPQPRALGADPWRGRGRLERPALSASHHRHGPCAEPLHRGRRGAASAFLRANLVDRILLYRAPIVIGGGRPSIGDIGLTRLADAHDRWQFSSRRQLGKDTLDIYEAHPCSPA